MISHGVSKVFVGCRTYGLLTEHIQKEKTPCFFEDCVSICVVFLAGGTFVWLSMYIVILEATQRGNPLTGLKI